MDLDPETREAILEILEGMMITAQAMKTTVASMSSTVDRLLISSNRFSDACSGKYISKFPNELQSNNLEILPGCTSEFEISDIKECCEESMSSIESVMEDNLVFHSGEVHVVDTDCEEILLGESSFLEPLMQNDELSVENSVEDHILEVSNIDKELEVQKLFSTGMNFMDDSVPNLVGKETVEPLEFSSKSVDILGSAEMSISFSDDSGNQGFERSQGSANRLFFRAVIITLVPCGERLPVSCNVSFDPGISENTWFYFRLNQIHKVRFNEFLPTAAGGYSDLYISTLCDSIRDKAISDRMCKCFCCVDDKAEDMEVCDLKKKVTPFSWDPGTLAILGKKDYYVLKDVTSNKCQNYYDLGIMGLCFDPGITDQNVGSTTKSRKNLLVVWGESILETMSVVMSLMQQQGFSPLSFVLGMHLTFGGTVLAISCIDNVVLKNTIGNVTTGNYMIYALIKTRTCGVNLTGNWLFDPGIVNSWIQEFSGGYTHLVLTNLKISAISKRRMDIKQPETILGSLMLGQTCFYTMLKCPSSLAEIFTCSTWISHNAPVFYKDLIASLNGSYLCHIHKSGYYATSKTQDTKLVIIHYFWHKATSLEMSTHSEIQ